jgi:hypothetical protein
MSDNLEQLKQILRRRCIAVFVLEQLHVTQRCAMYSQSSVRLSTEKIIQDVLEDLARARRFLPGWIRSTVNRFDEEYNQNLHNKRMGACGTAIRRFAIIDFNRAHRKKEDRTRFEVSKRS